MKLQCPAPGRPITSPYGPRRHPITGQIGKMHRGIDYGGTFDVLSAGDGIVYKVSYNGNKVSGGGHVVIIKHASNLYSVYYHGRERTKLKVGDRVQAGDFIYVSGSTGASTGPHLHFETRTGSVGQWGTDKDPNIFFSGASVTPQTPGGIPVNGHLDKTTWKAWQTVLKEKYGYTGIIDGNPGRMSWSAVQRSVKQHYKGSIDGIPGSNTYKAIQSKLKALGFYTGVVDGVFGRGSISALQRALNEGKY